MKLTTKKLKKLIREELEKMTEAADMVKVEEYTNFEQYRNKYKLSMRVSGWDRSSQAEIWFHELNELPSARDVHRALEKRLKANVDINSIKKAIYVGRGWSINNLNVQDSIKQAGGVKFR